MPKLLFIVLAAALLACGSKDATPNAAKPAALPEGTTLLEGTLKHQEVPAVKSVRAYLGVEFTLTTADGDKDLWPTAEVPKDKLMPLVGKKVRVTGRYTEGTAPRPEESAPLGMDGKPIKRGAGHQVLAIEAL